MLLFLFITLAIGLILFYDGYKKELKKDTDKYNGKELRRRHKDDSVVWMTLEEKRKYDAKKKEEMEVSLGLKKKSLWWHMWHDDNFRSSGYYY